MRPGRRRSRRKGCSPAAVAQTNIRGRSRGKTSGAAFLYVLPSAVSASARLAVAFGMASTAVSTLTVRVLLFASYAEMLGLDDIELTFDGAATVEDAIGRLRALPGGERLPPKPLCAVNLSQVRLDTPLASGDEVAVLPPLAGG